MENQQIPPLTSQSEINSLPGIGDLLSRTWQIYKERIWVFLGIMILPLLAVLFILLAGLLVILLTNLLRISLEGGFLLIFNLLLFIFIFILAVIIRFWPQVALLYAIKEREQKIGIKRSLAKSWPKILSYFWISLLVGIITFLGFLLFIIPGIIFTIWFSLATYVLVAEGLTGTKALSRSKQLVSGNWWRVFWRFLVIITVGAIIFLPLIFIEKLANIPDIASTIFLFLFMLFSAIYGFLIYEDLKKLKEGVIV